MKKTTLLLLLLSTLFSVFAQSPGDRKITLIPEPVSLQKDPAGKNFYLSPATRITCSNPALLGKMAEQFAERLATATGFSVKSVQASASLTGGIHLQLKDDMTIPEEGYRLLVNHKGVTITSRKPAGIFYGLQTLLQLLPAEIMSREKSSTRKNWDIPFVTIEDYPRFGWRGLMLDVSRHFFTVDQVKDYIDQMVKYKFNLLHLHLTDDQGWRIEIKSLPKLTEVGAWRVDKTGTFGRFSPPAPDEPRTYGGFYTQEDIRELVRYAGERFVNILPEIDVPGHSLAAIAAYPELSCTPGSYAVNSGEQFMIWPGGGQHFYGTLDNTICPALEASYVFLDKVFTEVAALFPFEYIHMGGDETARNFWEKSEQIGQLMKEKGLKNLDEVQSYFVKRVEKIINSKGKKMIGWDEILDGGLAPNAAVMSWRGMKGGIEAARQGHEVVMSPTDFAYIDYMQGDAIIEPPVYATLRLKKAYQFEPVPEGVEARLVKGGQANLWTEQVYNMRHAQYMTWPRAFAIAEVLWSAKPAGAGRNWNDFVTRTEAHFLRLDAAAVKYAPSIYDPSISATVKDSVLTVTLNTEIEGLRIHYSFDNSFPDAWYPVYQSPLKVPKDASWLKCISYRDGKPLGRMISMPVSELKKRAGIK
ncbi:MAG: family 20 glycosylhydrolase [Chitinophagaceae bacterium]|nr:family 20 glycosylhydrolase [Chitinophagaceae bacterium]